MVAEVMSGSSNSLSSFGEHLGKHMGQVVLSHRQVAKVRSKGCEEKASTTMVACYTGVGQTKSCSLADSCSGKPTPYPFLINWISET